MPEQLTMTMLEKVIRMHMYMALPVLIAGSVIMTIGFYQIMYDAWKDRG